MTNILLAVLSVLTLSVTCAGEPIVLDGTLQGYLNPSWELTAKDLIVKDGTPFLKLETRGNCRYEYEQQCTPRPDGGMDCHMVPKWVCDYDAALFALPSSVVLRGKEVRYQNDGQDILIGTTKSFLWFKWVKLEDYASIWTDLKAARLILRDAREVKLEIQRQSDFRVLHRIPKAENSR